MPAIRADMRAVLFLIAIASILTTSSASLFANESLALNDGMFSSAVMSMVKILKNSVEH